MARPQDFSILNKNSRRTEVIAVLGAPAAESKDFDGMPIDSMRVAHGRGAGTRAAVGTARWVGGIATLGLTEAALKDAPPEPVCFNVFYGPDGRIRRVEPLNDRAVRVFKQQGINSSTAADPVSPLPPKSVPDSGQLPPAPSPVGSASGSAIPDPREIERTRSSRSR